MFPLAAFELTTELVTVIAAQLVVVLTAFVAFYREITKIRTEANAAAKEAASKAADASEKAGIAAEKAIVADKKLDTISEHVNGSLARSDIRTESTQDMVKQLLVLLQAGAQERIDLAAIQAAPKAPQDVNVVNAAQPVHVINPETSPIPVTAIDVGAIATEIQEKTKEADEESK